MCVVIAKYFSGTGWVLAKNRDQNYVPDITFVDKDEKDVGEILVMYDKTTKYCEGTNHKGVSIITASLTPIIEDETDGDDGKIIYNALRMSTPKEAAEFLREKELVCFALIANKNECYLLEGVRDFNKINSDDDKKYLSTLRKIPTTEIVTRTNHGTDFPWAGFHKGIDKLQDKYYESSITRESIAALIAKKAKKPMDLIDGLSERREKNLQMNIFRIAEKTKDMRTIFQTLIVPKDKVVYVRPIQAKMNIDTDIPHVRLEVLDNDIVKQRYSDQKKLNLCKIERYKNGEEHVCIKTEAREITSFREFLGN